MASTERERGGGIEDPPSGKQNDGGGGKYRVGGIDTKESAVESADWSGEETDESVS